MKRILLCTDGSVFSQVSYHYAAWLAIRLAATVDVLYVTNEQSQAAAEARNFSGTIGVDASDALLHRLVELEHEKAKLNHQRAKQILQDAHQVIASYGVEIINLIHETGSLVDRFHEFEAQADLILLGKRGESAEVASGHLGANTERIIRASHKPCLVTSSHFQPIERLLLAYDGSSSCKKVLQFLIDSPAFKGLELHLLTITKSSEDEPSMAGLDSAKQQARAGGFEPICRTVKGNPETAIAQYAEAANINLLLMGAYGHNRIRYLVIGSTTTQILRGSNIPVLLFR
ncbi:universal stress protein [Nodosilinea nodulosa]|uniref:universal stress protein n=1 Tax=Nodosilinea nodulosa TaxID=416001 RepID=UPI00031B780E|nr:universal stress protein [Nodosilinea nodulosa]